MKLAWSSIRYSIQLHHHIECSMNDWISNPNWQANSSIFHLELQSTKLQSKLQANFTSTLQSPIKTSNQNSNTSIQLQNDKPKHYYQKYQLFYGLGWCPSSKLRVLKDDALCESPGVDAHRQGVLAQCHLTSGSGHPMSRCSRPTACDVRVERTAVAQMHGVLGWGWVPIWCRLV